MLWYLNNWISLKFVTQIIAVMGFQYFAELKVAWVKALIVNFVLFIWIIFILNLQSTSAWSKRSCNWSFDHFKLYFCPPFLSLWKWSLVLLLWSFEKHGFGTATLIFRERALVLIFGSFEMDIWYSYWHFKNDLYCSFLLRLFDFFDFAAVTGVWISEVVHL